MSEAKEPVALPADIFRNTTSPPVHSVTNVHVSVNVTEISVTLGRQRILISAETNIPLPTIGIEWFQSLSVNPIAAKQMYLGIARAVELYERQFGKIPEDPNFRLAPMPEGAASSAPLSRT
jgi:hypothetical protein